jgi:hypothetical protein
MKKRKRKKKPAVRNSVSPNRKYKDSLFRFLFGNKDHKEWTLSLFNAINGTDYRDPQKLELQDSGNILFLKVQEDEVFLYGDVLSFFEHQSTWTPNMPIRMLEYAAKQIAGMIDKEAVYHTALLTIPRPKFYVFYNGFEKELSENAVLKLSNNYDTNNRDEGIGKSYDLEVIVHVININSGKNEAIQARCKPLEEYTWIISAIRRKKEQGMGLREAIVQTIRELPEDYVTRDCILAEQGRITGMLLDPEGDARQFENLKRVLRKEAWEEGRKEGRKEGLKEGREEGINKTKAEMVQAMLQEGLDDTLILRVVKVTPEFVSAMRKTAANETE